MNTHISNCGFDVILFVDDHYITTKKNVTRTFHTPEKCSDEPFIHTGQFPWDMSPLICGSVGYDPMVEKYRMWYHASPPVKPGFNPHYNMSLALAQSDRPLGKWNPVFCDLLEYQGRKTSMIFSSTPREHFIETCSVLLDPQAKDEKKYLMAYCACNNKKAPTVDDRYYRLAWSSDGIHWRRGRKFTVSPPGKIDRHCLLKNPRNDEYLFYYRGEKKLAKDVPTEDTGRRTVMLMTSYDLKNWKPMGMVMEVGDDYPGNINIYSLNPFFRGNTLMGIYQLHNQHQQQQLVTAHLCWSHNHVDFSRRKEQFIPLGGPGQWDRFNQTVASCPVIRGDDMYFYYSGRMHRHSGYVDPKNDRGPLYGGISVATMKLDRFASLAASFDGGYFSTAPLDFSRKKKLLINAEARWGRIDVDFYHDKKKVHSAMIQGVQGVQIPVKLPPQLCRQPVKLKFTLANAEIFAIYSK